ncbi:hypothetical protein Tco_0651614 [Tanacetum coccineum]|uniref:CCHC-type domain-containing protein n=1 Tax=Tanacetum coccineum TaxID=301880 RepID=A0ABQ4WVB7_9ASTR
MGDLSRDILSYPPPTKHPEIFDTSRESTDPCTIVERNTMVVSFTGRLLKILWQNLLSAVTEYPIKAAESREKYGIGEEANSHFSLAPEDKATLKLADWAADAISLAVEELDFSTLCSQLEEIVIVAGLLWYRLKLLSEIYPGRAPNMVGLLYFFDVLEKFPVLRALLMGDLINTSSKDLQRQGHRERALNILQQMIEDAHMGKGNFLAGLDWRPIRQPSSGGEKSIASTSYDVKDAEKKIYCLLTSKAKTCLSQFILHIAAIGDIVDGIATTPFSLLKENPHTEHMINDETEAKASVKRFRKHDSDSNLEHDDLAVGTLIYEGKLIDALALSDRCLRDGASNYLLRLLIELEEENHVVHNDAIKTRFGGNAKNTGYKGRDQRTGKQEQPKALLTIDAGVIDWSGKAEEEEKDHALMAFNSNRHFARECRTKGNQDSRRRDAWNSGNKDGRRSGKQEDSKALVTIDGEGVDWTSHSEEEEDYALMACNSSGSDTEVTSCSKECKESYAKLKKLYDAQREQLGDASIEIQAYTQALKKVEAQLVAHQQSQLWYEEKIRFMKIDLDDKTDVLTYHKKLLAEAKKVKEDLKAKVEKWHNSSKNLGKLLNTQMSANDKFGLGYGDYRYDGILSYENEVLQSVFMNKESDLENQPLYDRFVTTEGMHVVPPPMAGNYMPSRPDIEIDYSQFTYGPKQTQTSESETQTSDFDTCESDCSVETHESLPEPTVNEPKVVSQPKVWSDAPIIEEETVKNQFTHSKNPKVDKKGLGYGFTTKACFVCGSLSHLIRDCDFHEKRMAKQAELNNRMRKKSSQREIRPIWNNVQRVNHKNQFVPTAVLTRTGKIPVSTARASGTNNVSTARHNFNSQAVLTNAARKISTVKPFVNRLVLLGDKGKLLLSPQQVVIGDQKDITGTKSPNTMVDQDLEIDYPHRTFQNKWIVDSGCSRHMTGNKA